jgi:hypothetical protein
MLLSFEEHILALQSWDSRTEMEAFLTTCDEGSLVLGADAEQHVEFHSVLIQLNECIKVAGEAELTPGRFGIGILSQGLGLKPHLLLIPERYELVLGFNAEIAAFNIKHRESSYRIDLNRSPFRSFVRLRELKVLLIFHEIGVLGLGEDGQVLWRHERDVITYSMIQGRRLSLHFMDASSVEIDVVNGSLHAE